MHLGKWLASEYLEARDALIKFRAISYANMDAGFKKLFLALIRKYNRDEVEL
jgi:hypothetical protein